MPEYVQWALVGVGLLVLGWFASGRRSSDEEDEENAAERASRPRRRSPRRPRWRPRQRHPLAAGTRPRRPTQLATQSGGATVMRAAPPRPRLKQPSVVAPAPTSTGPRRSLSWSVGGSVPGFVVEPGVDGARATRPATEEMDGGIAWREV